MTDATTMTTYKRADGEMIAGEYGWVTEMESVAAEAEDAEESIEFVEEVWTLQSRRTFIFPVCGADGCQEAIQFWGLCEKHAREDDPDSFTAENEGADADAV